MTHATPVGPDGVLKIAIFAVGGQGGGVLTGWITDLARRAGWHAQATSVAGVAQRTGSTIYYVEMAPGPGPAPVFALSPAPGDVDVLIAAELMEAGRAINRGFVTPDRTTLIASRHRVLATVEKLVPGDGRAPDEPVLEEARRLAHRAICPDLEALAHQAGSVISASLFGALAGSGALPFGAAHYEETIRASGRGVEASLRAFAAGREAAQQETRSAAGQGPVPDLRGPRPAPLPVAGAPAPSPGAAEPRGPARLMRRWQELSARAAALPEPVRAMARAGLVKLVDYQDPDYGAEYLATLERIAAADRADRGWRYSVAAAKHIANAMAYDDMIRVADLKTRAARGARIRREQGLEAETALQVTEYFHPRAEELASVMPHRLGAWWQARAGRMGWLDRRVNRGRRLRSDRLRGHLALRAVTVLRPWRRRLLRHAQETAHLRRWLATAERLRGVDYELAVEVLECRRLIKGYSDTHARGLSQFDRVLGALPLIEGREDAADWLRRLRAAALADAEGEALDGAIATVESFAAPPTAAARSA